MVTLKKFMVPVLALNLISCSNTQDTQVKEENQAITTEINPSEYQTKEMENMKQVHDFIKECGFYYLATDDQGQPRVRPFGTIHIFDGKLYIQTGHKKRTAKQISGNPKVELCAYNTQKGEWIRVSGTLVEDYRIEAKKSMLDEYSNLRSMYDENDGNTAVYFFTEATAYLSAFSSEDKEIKW